MLLPKKSSIASGTALEDMGLQRERRIWRLGVMVEIHGCQLDHGAANRGISSSDHAFVQRGGKIWIRIFRISLSRLKVERSGWVVEKARWITTLPM